MNTRNAFQKEQSRGGAHSEGPVAKGIEQQTAKVPSDAFLWLALGSIGTSLVLQALGKKETSNFVGQWAPTILILGLYNKIVKIAGSEGEGISDSPSRDTEDEGLSSKSSRNSASFSSQASH